MPKGKKRTALELQKPATIQFFWRWHTMFESGPRRVWRSDWAHDQFEIIESSEFNGFLVWAQKFGFVVNEVGEDD